METYKILWHVECAMNNDSKNALTNNFHVIFNVGDEDKTADLDLVEPDREKEWSNLSFEKGDI